MHAPPCDRSRPGRSPNAPAGAAPGTTWCRRPGALSPVPPGGQLHPDPVRLGAPQHVHLAGALGGREQQHRLDRGGRRLVRSTKTCSRWAVRWSCDGRGDDPLSWPGVSSAGSSTRARGLPGLGDDRSTTSSAVASPKLCSSRAREASGSRPLRTISARPCGSKLPQRCPGLRRPSRHGPRRAGGHRRGAHPPSLSPANVRRRPRTPPGSPPPRWSAGTRSPPDQERFDRGPSSSPNATRKARACGSARRRAASSGGVAGGAAPGGQRRLDLQPLGTQHGHLAGTCEQLVEKGRPADTGLSRTTSVPADPSFADSRELPGAAAGVPDRPARDERTRTEARVAGSNPGCFTGATNTIVVIPGDLGVVCPNGRSPLPIPRQGGNHGVPQLARRRLLGAGDPSPQRQIGSERRVERRSWQVLSGSAVFF